MTRLELQHRLTGVWQWFTKTSVELSEPERRRARVLAVFTLFLLVSDTAFLLLNLGSTRGATTDTYTALILGLSILLAFAFGLNRAGHYTLAASLVVTCAWLGTWAAALLSIGTLDTDVVPLLYIIAPVVLCSFLLPARATVILGIVQFALLGVLWHLTHLVTASPAINLMSYIVFISVLCIVSGIISRLDLEQIDRQTKELTESHAQLRELAIRDALTGLYNRRFLEETLALELVRAEREQSSLGVIMVDVDYFKKFNDAHGHAAGDALLRQISASLREHIRSSDVACRYGGDELTVILPNSSQEVTQRRAEVLRAGAKSILLEYEHHYLEPITISLGVAMFPQNGETPDSVLKAADNALYIAKQSGRDRVSVANFKPMPDASATPPPPSQSPRPTAPRAQLYTTPPSKILPGKIESASR